MVEDPNATRVAVRETYDRIAAHFSQTRREPWPAVAEFLEGRTGLVGLDLGCGNGRHAELLAARVDRVLALDLSVASLRTTRERSRRWGPPPALLQADAATLPLYDDVVELAVYVAALHHLPTRALRLASLDELARVLAPGGAAIVSAWSTTHARFDRERGFDTTVDWTLPDGEKVPRYYHIYDPAEFRTDLEASALRVVETFVAKGNCYAVVGPTRPAGQR